MKKTKIAITGGIGSGKSTVARYLKTYGFSVFSCDEIYREIMQSQTYIRQIKELFPTVVHDGGIDKKQLAALVFGDASAMKKLNAVAHPLIMQTLLQKMELTESRFVFAEVPLLFEEGYERLFDKVWVVTRSLDERIRAAMLRDDCSKEDICNRIRAQFDYDSVSAAAYYKKLDASILRNDGTEAELKTQIQELLNTLNNR